MKTRLQITVSTILLSRIEKYCSRVGITKTQLVVHAVTEYLAKFGF